MQNISYGEFNKINSINFTSEYGKLKNIKLEGSTTQATRSGKNLLNLLKCSFSGCTLNSDNKSLTCSINNHYYAYVKTTELNNWLLQNKGKKITFSTGTPLNKNTSIVISGTGSNGSTYQEANETGTGKCSITIANDFTTITSIELRFNRQGTTFTDTTTVINYAMLEEGSTATEYEPYGVMPSPDYPSPIENVEGKNIWNKSEISKTQTVNMVVGELNVKDVPIPFTFSSYLISNALTDTNVRVSFADSNNSNIGATKYGNTVTSTNKRSSITINEIPEGTVKIRFGIRMQDGGHTEKTQLEAGTVATPYVPYNSLEFKVEGKNIFDCANSKIIYNNGNTSYERLDNGLKLISDGISQYNMIYFLVDTVENLKGKTLTLSSDILFSKEKQYVDFGLYYTDFNGGNRKSFGIIKSIKTEGYYTIKGIVEEGENRDYVCIGLRPNMDSNFAKGDYTIYDNLQVEIGETATDYEPYKSQVVTFPLAEGQKLMEGSYLADDGIHNKRKQYTFTGNETVNITTYGNNKRFTVVPSSYNPSYKGQDTVGLCNYLKRDYMGTVGNANLAQEPCFFIHPSGILITMTPDTNIVNETQLKTWLATKHTNGTPVIVEYELAEPETVPYTEEQQEAWNKIKNFPIFIGQNNLTSTALLSAIYIKKITTDTKVDYNLYNEDYIKIATKNNIHPKFKIQMLDEYENVIDEITGDISRDNSGSISNNYQQGVRRSVSLTFIDTEGKFLPDSNSNLIWANKKFKLFSGLLDTDTNEIFWFSEGIYYFSNVSSSRNGADKLTTVNGVDKFGKFGSELGYNQLESTYLIPAGTKIYDAIKGILNIDIGNGYPIDPIEPVLDPLYIDEVCPYDISKSPSSYLSEMLIELADIIGCDIYYDADGRLHVDSGTIDFSYSNKPSIWDFSDVLPEYMNPSITTNFAEFINTVKVVGNNTNDKTYEYTAVNNNPESPTRVDLIGTKSTYIESASVYNTDRAKDYAEYKLNMFSILQLAVTFSCTFLPHLDVNKVITITDSYYKYEKQRFVIQSITLPLSYDGVMSISACNVASLPYYEGGN